MKKMFISALLLASALTAGAQEKGKSITLPSWINDINLSGYGMVQYSYTDEESAKANSFNRRLVRLALDGHFANEFHHQPRYPLNPNTAPTNASARLVGCVQGRQKYDFLTVK